MVAKKKPAKKVPAKKKPLTNKAGFTYDHESGTWKRPLDLMGISQMIAKLNARVYELERQNELAEDAGKREPRWYPYSTTSGKPVILGDPKVKIMVRDGSIEGPMKVDRFCWDDIGSKTIVAYCVE